MEICLTNWICVFNFVSPAMMLKSNKIVNERLTKCVSLLNTLEPRWTTISCGPAVLWRSDVVASVSAAQSIRNRLVVSFGLQRKGFSHFVLGL